MYADKSIKIILVISLNLSLIIGQKNNDETLSFWKHGKFAQETKRSIIITVQNR